MATYNFAAIDDKNADKAIKSIRTKGAALRKTIHETAVGLIMHMAEHGRHTKFMPLADAIGDALGKNQRKAFLEWVLAYTWLEIDAEDKGAFVKNKEKKIDLEEAKLKPFWDMEKPPTDPVPFDLQKMVAAFIKNAEKAIAENRFVGDVTVVESIKSLSGTVTTVESGKPAAVTA